MPKYTPDSYNQDVDLTYSMSDTTMVDEVNDTMDSGAYSEPTPASANGSGRLRGISQEELNDPNKIEVVIHDTKAPLIVFFGPPSCGKTMTLIRLTRYLKQVGYTVKPIRTFRPSYDTHYKKMCDNFNQMVTDRDAASSTNNISFMLVEVLKSGRRVCQILEAPGEYYFNPQRPEDPFPAYVNTIIHSETRKVWCNFVEQGWMDKEDRDHYVDRIKELKKQMSPRDKTIFVFSKIDRTQHVLGQGVVDMKTAIEEYESQYSGIFVKFKNENPLTSLFSTWRCRFVPFQTGTFTETTEGSLSFQQGNDKYPEGLWKAILKDIRG